MKYFKLRGDSEPKVIGVRNGVHQGEIKWKYYTKNKARDIEEYFSLKKLQANENYIEPINFEIEYVEAYKSAILTDFFRFTPVLWGIAFFVTDKVKNLFKQFKLPLHTYIPVKIYYKETEYKYWALYIPYSYRFDSIDFEKTVFFSGTELQGKFFYQFKDEQEKSKHVGIWIEKVFFNEKFDKSLDLFTTAFGGTGYYISEKLKAKIEAEGLTGIVIREPKEPELIFE